jgi:hypothetical protein
MPSSDSNLPDRRIKDLTGKRFARLLAIEFVAIVNHDARWLCDCDCGNRIVVSGHNLRRGTTRSCGCYSRQIHAASASRTFRINLEGKKFGRLTVLRFSHTHVFNEQCSEAKWVCLCDCGTTTTVFGSHLRKGSTTSCGRHFPSGKDNPNYKHGLSRKNHPQHYIYDLWLGIRSRILDPTNISYPTYGGAGIPMCEEWKTDSAAFANYILTNIGERPTKKHSIDRIINPLGYVPDNLRWLTPYEQNRNKTTNRMITANGKTQCITDWAKELGRSPRCIKARIEHLGWTPENAVTSNSKNK